MCDEPHVCIEVRPGQHVSVGRRPTNDVVVPHPSIGSRHCILRHTPAGVTIEDAGSPGGTWVDGQHVREATLLAPGHTVRIGQLRFAVLGT